MTGHQGRPKEQRQCKNPDCRKLFQPFNWKQVYCREPACRDMAAEDFKVYHREWMRGLRRNYKHSRAEFKDYKGLKCFLCGKPLRNGEVQNHIVCIEKESSRTDGDWLFCDSGEEVQE